MNTFGSYTCGCRPGYTKTDTDCRDIDECENRDSCLENASCKNNEGSFTCTCNSGYEGKGLKSESNDFKSLSDCTSGLKQVICVETSTNV